MDYGRLHQRQYGALSRICGGPPARGAAYAGFCHAESVYRARRHRRSGAPLDDDESFPRSKRPGNGPRDSAHRAIFFLRRCSCLPRRGDLDDGEHYHGYGAVDFYGVEEHFGDLAKLREWVDDAHQLGIKVMQDEVANHTGPYHPWVQDPPTTTWYHGSEAAHPEKTGKPGRSFDPHAPRQARRPVCKRSGLRLRPAHGPPVRGRDHQQRG